MSARGYVRGEPICRSAMLDVPPAVTTCKEAVVPGMTWYSSPDEPLGVGTWKVILSLLQFRMVNVGMVPGAAQVVPWSVSCSELDVPCELPKPDPYTVTVCPAAACAGDRWEMPGAPSSRDAVVSCRFVAVSV